MMICIIIPLHQQGLFVKKLQDRVMRGDWNSLKMPIEQGMNRARIALKQVAKERRLQNLNAEQSVRALQKEVLEQRAEADAFHVLKDNCGCCYATDIVRGL
mmetsp:Transcript_15209/g.23593  ORF Transcript_15209/g.23593 Transcript_15209/m.23593 type:complete len:101 (-) Transcript_15209:83-385(-)